MSRHTHTVSTKGERVCPGCNKYKVPRLFKGRVCVDCKARGKR